MIQQKDLDNAVFKLETQLFDKEILLFAINKYLTKNDLSYSEFLGELYNPNTIFGREFVYGVLECIASIQRTMHEYEKEEGLMIKKEDAIKFLGEYKINSNMAETILLDIREPWIGFYVLRDLDDVVMKRQEKEE